MGGCESEIECMCERGRETERGTVDSKNIAEQQMSHAHSIHRHLLLLQVVRELVHVICEAQVVGLCVYK